MCFQWKRAVGILHIKIDIIIIIIIHELDKISIINLAVFSWKLSALVAHELLGGGHVFWAFADPHVSTTAHLANILHNDHDELSA